MVTALVTDSNAQMPPDLASRFDVTVVPLVVTIDGHEYLEGVDLTADDFYARFTGGGPPPSVSTSQPSPGQFVAAYAAAAEAGADNVLSVHIGSGLSGTVNSARLAAESSPIPVRVVDTGTASFAVTLCAWRAGEVLAGGGTVEEAATAAEAVAATVDNVFVVRALDLARTGGRLADDGDDAEAGGGGWGAAGAEAGIPVLTLAGGAMRPIGSASGIDDAAALMVAHVRAAGTGLRVGVGLADAGTLALVEAVAEGLRHAAEVDEVIRYRIGPSVGAHTGPGAVGVMCCPAVPADG